MSGNTRAVNPASVVQSLVYTLLDVFDQTRDLYITLKNKQKRDYEDRLRPRRYSDSRRFTFVDDDSGSEKDIVMDKAAVIRQFEDGVSALGHDFAVGDVVSQVAIQSLIITLQSVLVAVFLYGPTSSDPISRQLSDVLDASRAAGTSTVDILAAQLQRHLPLRRPSPQPAQSLVAQQHAVPYPTNTVPSSSTSTALVRTRRDSAPGTRTGHATSEVASRSQPARTETESTSYAGVNSYASESVAPTFYCLHALELQHHPAQPVGPSITSNSTPYCPQCKRDLNLMPGKSWEIYKDDYGTERCFRIQNRFVVKCHRDCSDGGYACVMCTRSATVDSVCGDVKALIRHVWTDHNIGEFEAEEDVVEVVEKAEKIDRRRDSAQSYSEPRAGGERSSRSVSLGPRRSQRRSRLPDYEREVETLEGRSSRRD